MRALLLSLVALVAFLLVLKFYPRSAEAGGDAPAGEPSEAFFLPPPPSKAPEGGRAEATDAPAAATTPRPEGEARPVPVETEPLPEAASAPENAAPRWLEEVRGAVVEDTADEIAIGRALLHRTPAEVQRVLERDGGDLAPARRRSVLAFSHARAGERDRALAIASEISDDAPVESRELSLLQALLTGSGTLARPASAGREGAIGLAMEMALLEREADAQAGAREYAAAARGYSDLLRHELQAPWTPGEVAALERWTRGLDEAQRHHRWDPRGAWPSVEIEVEAGDTLTHVRKRYVERYPGRLMCTGLIERANRIKGYIHEGQTLRVPTDPVSVLVDLDTRWLLCLEGEEVVASWPVGVGRAGEETIAGRFTVGEKQENPPWFPAGREMIPFGDPRNPLGTRWMGWFRDGTKTSYGFHGTNDPTSIGKAESDGCIRLRNEDVEALFELVPLSAPIVVQE